MLPTRFTRVREPSGDAEMPVDPGLECYEASGYFPLMDRAVLPIAMVS